MKKAPCCAPTSGVSSLMISRATVFRSRWPCSIPEKRARFEFSQSCSAFRAVVSRRLPIIWLMLSLSSATSPVASTLIERVRSPWVTAVETSAIARSCVVSVAGELVHVVGQALPRAGDALDLRLAAEPALGADLARDAGHLGGEGRELVDHRVDRLRELGDLAASRRR